LSRLESDLSFPLDKDYLFLDVIFDVEVYKFSVLHEVLDHALYRAVRFPLQFYAVCAKYGHGISGLHQVCFERVRAEFSRFRHTAYDYRTFGIHERLMVYTVSTYLVLNSGDVPGDTISELAKNLLTNVGHRVYRELNLTEPGRENMRYTMGYQALAGQVADCTSNVVLRMKEGRRSVIKYMGVLLDDVRGLMATFPDHTQYETLVASVGKRFDAKIEWAADFMAAVQERYGEVVEYAREGEERILPTFRSCRSAIERAVPPVRRRMIWVLDRLGRWLHGDGEAGSILDLMKQRRVI